MKRAQKARKIIIAGMVVLALGVGIIVPCWTGDPPPTGTIFQTIQK